MEQNYVTATMYTGIVMSNLCVRACVCLSVCLSVRMHISGTTRPVFTNFVHAAYGRDSVLLWWRYDAFAHNGQEIEDAKKAYDL